MMSIIPRLWFCRELRLNEMSEQTFDFVVVGSGFGGSVSAMRLSEKGYRVLVLERGRRFRDTDFPRSNWNVFKYLWLPTARCFGIQQISFLNLGAGTPLPLW